MKNVMMTSLLVAAAIGAVFAQTSGSGAGGEVNRAPSVDGTIKDGEYRFLQSFEDLRFGLSFSSDGKILYAAVEAPTTGWVAVGLGSKSMAGAYIVLGSWANGKDVVSEQRGVGHGHTEQSTKLVTASAVREIGGKTVMEFSVPAAQFARGPALLLSVSYGATDDMTERHQRHVSEEIPLPLR